MEPLLPLGHREQEGGQGDQGEKGLPKSRVETDQGVVSQRKRKAEVDQAVEEGACQRLPARKGQSPKGHNPQKD